MKYSFAVIALLGLQSSRATSIRNQLKARDLSQSSLVLLEAAIPTPTTLAELSELPKQEDHAAIQLKTETEVKVSAQQAAQSSKQSKNEHKQQNVVAQKLGTNSNQKNEQSHVRMAKHQKKTTLTIVQDFPKKNPDQETHINNVEMLQKKAHDFKIVPDEEHKITFTVVQDFPKKKDDNQVKNHDSIEMIQQKGKAKDFKMEPADQNKQTTLTIVQEFPKKKQETNHEIHNVEMIQHKGKANANANDLKIEPMSFHGKQTTLTIVQDFPKKPVDKPPTSIEMIQHTTKETELKENKPKDIKNFMVSAFTVAENWIKKTFDFNKK